MYPTGNGEEARFWGYAKMNAMGGNSGQLSVGWKSSVDRNNVDRGRE